MSSKKQTSSTANVSKQQIPAAAKTSELSCPPTNATTNATTASKSNHSAASDILGKTSMLKLLKS